MDERPMEQGEKKGKENRGGSFRIPEEALNILMKSKATAWQITVYLALARFTDETGKFSTAGYDAIYRHTAACPGTPQRPGKGRQLVEDLLKMGNKTPPLPGKLLYTPEVWHGQTGETAPETPNKHFPVTWVLNDFGGEKWVWFPNELVDGHGKFKQPLLRLKRCGDVAARLLLLLYSRNNMEEFGGIPPRPNVCQKYALERLQTAYDCTFWRAAVSTRSVHGDLSIPALGLSHRPTGEGKGEQLNGFFDALSSLINQGFLGEVVTVMDRDPDDPDARPMYELHFKSKGFQMGPRENALAERIDRILSKVHGKGMADTAGRFYDKFPVLSPIGIMPHVAGIYRPRFQIMNPKNYTILASWKRRAKDREMMLEFLKNLEERIGIASGLSDYSHEVQRGHQYEEVWN